MIEPQRPADSSALVVGDRARPFNEHDWRGPVGFYADLAQGPPRLHQLGIGGLYLEAGNPGVIAGFREAGRDLQREVDAALVEQADEDADRALAIGIKPEHGHVVTGLWKGQIRGVHVDDQVGVRGGVRPHEVRPAVLSCNHHLDTLDLTRLDSTKVDDRNQGARAVGVDLDVAPAELGRLCVGR